MKMLWFWGFLAVDNFDFTRKIVKKKFGRKTRENVMVLSKFIFGQKFDFSNSVKIETFFQYFQTLSVFLMKDDSRIVFII